MSELTEHLRHIGCLNKPRCIEAADLLDAQATELARLRKQEPVAYVSIIDDDKPRSDIIDRELPPLTPLYAAPIPPVTHCKLGCTAECKAKAHGCAGECPALPWQPDAPISPTPSADTWSGIMEVCRVRGTHGRSDYITTGNRMDNRCNLRVTFDGSELIEAEVARPPNTPDGMRMFAVIDMSAPMPPTPRPSADRFGMPLVYPTTPSQQEATTLLPYHEEILGCLSSVVDLRKATSKNGYAETVQKIRDFILARPDEVTK